MKDRDLYPSVDFLKNVSIDRDNNSFNIGNYVYDACDLELTDFSLCRKIIEANETKGSFTLTFNHIMVKEVFYKSLSLLKLTDKELFDYNKFCSAPDVTNDIDNIARVVRSMIPDGESVNNAKPFCYTSLMTPKEAKDKLGKSLWAKVVKIDDIKKTSVNYILNADKQDALMFCNAIIDGPHLSNSLQSVVSDVSRGVGVDSKIRCFFKNYINGKVESDKIKETSSMINDCVNMKLSLGEEFNPEWSIKRVQREHDDASSRQTYKSMGMSPDSRIVVPESFKSFAEQRKGGIKIKFLETAKDYMEEGLEMNHCIASYAKKAVNGEYITLSVIHEGKRATAGYNVSGGNINLDQVKSSFNKKDYTPEINSFCKSLSGCKDYQNPLDSGGGLVISGRRNWVAALLIACCFAFGALLWLI